jgi:hypothetical protein
MKPAASHATAARQRGSPASRQPSLLVLGVATRARRDATAARCSASIRSPSGPDIGYEAEMCLGAPIIKGAGIEAGRRTLVACLWLITWGGAPGLSACGAFRGDKFGATTEFNAHAHARGGPRGDAVAGLMLRSEVCEHEDLRVARDMLDETALIRFLERHGGVGEVERPRSDLSYVTLPAAPGKKGLRLRVASLASADDAGRELATAIAQHGSGSWGVHRSNLAILGPIQDPADVLDLVSTNKLACWGVLTIGSGADVYVIPGGYREL